MFLLSVKSRTHASVPFHTHSCTTTGMRPACLRLRCPHTPHTAPWPNIPAQSYPRNSGNANKWSGGGASSEIAQSNSQSLLRSKSVSNMFRSESRWAFFLFLFKRDTTDNRPNQQEVCVFHCCLILCLTAPSASQAGKGPTFPAMTLPTTAALWPNCATATETVAAYNGLPLLDGIKTMLKK